MGMKDLEKVRTALQFITDGDLSADYTSSTLPIQFLHNIGIELVYTGTPTGVVYVQATINGTNWDSLTTDPDPISLSGSAGSLKINLTQVPYAKLRIFYDRTSGTGTLNAWWMAKGLRI